MDRAEEEHGAEVGAEPVPHGQVEGEQVHVAVLEDVLLQIIRPRLAKLFQMCT